MGLVGLRVGEKKQPFLTLDSIFPFHLDLDWKRKIQGGKKKRKRYTQEDDERLTEKAQIK